MYELSGYPVRNSTCYHDDRRNTQYGPSLFRLRSRLPRVTLVDPGSCFPSSHQHLSGHSPLSLLFPYPKPNGGISKGLLDPSETVPGRRFQTSGFFLCPPTSTLMLGCVISQLRGIKENSEERVEHVRQRN